MTLESVLAADGLFHGICLWKSPTSSSLSVRGLSARCQSVAQRRAARGVGHSAAVFA